MDKLKWLCNPKRTGADVSNYVHYFTLDPRSGECVDMYLCVPCGKCDNCLFTKRYSFVQRCMFETYGHAFAPYFVTLTYDNDHVPKVYDPATSHHVNTLSVRDVQLFMKRLRINLVRHPRFHSFTLRYVACGEYGKTTKRPHYHLIIWGFNTPNLTDYKEVVDIITSSWSLGFVTCRLVDPRDDKAFRYTTKYLYKSAISQNLSVVCKREFRTMSKRGGSIGKPFLMNFAQDCRRLLTHDIKVFNHFENKCVDIHFDGWVCQQLFPSISRRVSSEVRRAFFELSLYVDLYKKNGALYDYEEYSSWLARFSSFARFVYVPDADFFDVYSLNYDYVYTPEECLYHLARWSEKVGCFTRPDIDTFVDSLMSDDLLRQRFIISLSDAFEPMTEEKIKARSYKARQDFNRSLSLEVL